MHLSLVATIISLVEATNFADTAKRINQRHDILRQVLKRYDKRIRPLPEGK